MIICFELIDNNNVIICFSTKYLRLTEIKSLEATKTLEELPENFFRTNFNLLINNYELKNSSLTAKEYFCINYPELLI